MNEPATLRASIAALEQAVALDPEFAEAWARLGARYVALYANATPSPEVRQAARRAADRAIALAPGLGDAWFTLSAYFLSADFNADSALMALQTAARLDPSNTRVLRQQAELYRTRGEWDLALVHARRAAELDPRLPGHSAALADIYLRMRRNAEARAEADRGLGLAPAHLQLIQIRAMAELASGNLEGARAVLGRSGANPVELATYMSIYQDLGWALSGADREVVVRLTPAAFDGDRGSWGLALAQLYRLRGDSLRSRAYGDSARIALAGLLRATPDDAQLHVLHGVALAYAGRPADAIASGERGLAMKPPERDAVNGAYSLHQMVRIRLMADERARAAGELEKLLGIPYYVTREWIGVDPELMELARPLR